MIYKVVYNTCYGGFSLSNKAVKLYLEKKGLTPKWYQGKSHVDSHWYINKSWDFSDRKLTRHDPVLVQVVEELGEKSFGDCAYLTVGEVDGLYRIDEYDGYESLITSQDYYDWVDPSKE